MGLSIHTGNPIAHPEFSNIRLHCETNDHLLSHQNFKIIKSVPIYNKLLITESLLINNCKPSLNTNLRSLPLYIQCD